MKIITLTYKIKNLKMDAKLTLRFDATVIEDAKKYVAERGISLSRFVEILLRKAIASSFYNSIEELPVSDWVMMVAEGSAEYQTSQKKSRKQMKDEFFNSKKWRSF